MAFFDSFTDSIKQKWLQFFQVNRDWITLQMAIESVYTPDGGKRPSSFLILGVVNALEPKLAQLMFPFAKLNPDADTLIEVLGLHFDPDITLGNRLSPTQEPAMYSRVSQEVTEDISEYQPSARADFSVVEEEIVVQEFTIDVTEQQWEEEDSLGSENAFDTISLSEESIAHEFPPAWEEEDSLGSENAFDTISLSEESIAHEFEPASDLETADELSGMSFESISLIEDNENLALEDLNLSDENGFDDLNQPDESEFRDVISDVWGDDTSLLQEGEENNSLLGEELPSEVFDESEMARLFPNN
ncbi:DUF5331 domain-containing protein [Anabaena sphaerica FACHB-251]|uniref:DUF5331 domain-containing protein n=1 Tax=Anabaena sphaerica FACHB-251 TaxID=2692883 RepID=A0A927A1B3_9NOST|nr:DUF5331 domain-containing protein [Anabaena sphaerica]MBD2295912.1 DUF5331 domain-containing protein [Anabaena sphaerica FACHB-251]